MPDADRSRPILLAPDYGHAGALELFGPRYGLGRVVSAHNSYWVWSRHVADAPIIVAVDVSEKRLRAVYEEVSTVATFHCDGCMPARNDLPILVARRPRHGLGETWSAWKHFE